MVAGLPAFLVAAEAGVVLVGLSPFVCLEGLGLVCGAADEGVFGLVVVGAFADPGAVVPRAEGFGGVSFDGPLFVGPACTSAPMPKKEM